MAKTLLVLGATGGTGQHVVSQALDAGVEVTAFVRNSQKLAGRNDRLRVVAGSLDDAAALDAAMRGQDAVVSALGRGKSFNAEGLIARSVPAVIASMNRRGVRRLVFTSAFGVGDAVRDIPFMPRLFGRTLLRGIYADKAIGEAAVRASGLDWTIVQPAMLTDGPRTGRYRCGERLALSGMPKISRADVADLILKSIDDAGSVRKTLIVSY